MVSANFLMSWSKCLCIAIPPVCVLMLPNFALSADEQRDLFAKLDKNSDGVLEASELGTAQQPIFERLLRQSDGNADGKISLQEFKQATNPQAKQPLESKLGGGQKKGNGKNRAAFDGEKVFGFLDTNKDGKLTKAELPERAKERIGKMFDRLGKEELEKTEFISAFNQYRKQNGQNIKINPAGKDRSEALFKRLDTNKDGKVMIGEVPEKFRPVALRLFKQTGKEPSEGLTMQDMKQITANPKRPGKKSQLNKKPQSKQKKTK